MKVKLRGKQRACVEALRQGIREGHQAQMLYGPTGFGKTEIAAHMMANALAKRKRAVFVVDMNNLVSQTSQRFYQYNINHGLIQADNTRGDYEMALVVSVQTAESRGWPSQIDLLFVDEAHMMRKSVIELIKERPAMKVVGLSATPFARGLGDIYTNVVAEVTTNQLIKDGFLAPLRYYQAIAPDMSGAKKTAGEWSPAEVEKRGTVIVGDIVREWQSKTNEIFGGPVKTLGYCASVAHGEDLCRQFAHAGYNFQLVSYRDKNDEARKALMEEFRRPDSQIHGLFSCEALTRGTDVPDVKIGIGARPYSKSFSQHIQQIGRIMRTAEGKSFGVWIDHAGNCMRFWDDQQALFKNGVKSLKNNFVETARKEPDPKQVEMRLCPMCATMLSSGNNICPSCGHKKRTRSLVEQKPGEVVEIDGKQVMLQPYLSDRKSVWAQLCWMANMHGKDDVAAQKFCQAQYRNMYGEFYRGRYENTTPMQASVSVQNKVRQQLIRYSKKRNAQRDKARHQEFNRKVKEQLSRQAEIE